MFSLFLNLLNAANMKDKMTWTYLFYAVIQFQIFCKYILILLTFIQLGVKASKSTLLIQVQVAADSVVSCVIYIM